jgi:hypothetical protein
MAANTKSLPSMADRSAVVGTSGRVVEPDGELLEDHHGAQAILVDVVQGHLSDARGVPPSRASPE